jgi:two-component system chemotaxis sensor kinase CheA
VTRDPYRYFRIEAREILDGLGRGLLELDRGAPAATSVAQLLRLAHTLKGAARVVRLPAIGEAAHRMEDLLTPHRESTAAVPRQAIEELQEVLDGIAERVAAIDQPPASPAARDPAPDSVRVAIADLDRLLEGITAVGIEASAASEQLAALEALHRRAEELARLLATTSRARADGDSQKTPAGIAESLRDDIADAARGAATRLDSFERGLAGVREELDRLRLIPATALFDDLERVARDAAANLGKQIEVACSGGEIRIDARVQMFLRVALAHAVRNAVAHGIEHAGERLAAGKPAAGLVTIRVRRAGYRIEISCDDDGAGIDEDAVRRALARLGRMSAADASALGGESLVRELLRGGVTTETGVTELSGRGVGLDAVREAVAELDGEVALYSRPGRGTTLSIEAPLSLSALPALRVHGGESAAVIPLDAVRSTSRIADGDLARSPEGENLAVGGELIPFIPLAELMRSDESARIAPSARLAVVIEAGGRSAALGVDRLSGIERVVVRKIPEIAAVDAVVAGAAIDHQGKPWVLLAPDALVASALGRGPVPVPPGPEPRLPILVIDDSLTTRMLERSILESAGYSVDVALSAEEALEKAARRRYAVFVVDVEMPGMNGFEFVARTREDPRLKDIPSIMVSSRGGGADLRRGKEVGARAYIVKGEFDQGVLLDAIRRLVG